MTTIQTLFKGNCVELYKGQYCGQKITNPKIKRSPNTEWPATDIPSDYISKNIKLPNEPQKPLHQLNLVFGEATMNISNYVYGNDANNRRNGFLPPASLLNRTCDSNSGYVARDLHLELLRRSIIIVDLFDDIVSSNEVNESYKLSEAETSSYYNDLANQIIEIALCTGVKSIKSVHRYDRLAKSSLASRFESIFKNLCKSNAIVYSRIGGHLSNTAGGLDIKKLNTVFI